MLMMETLSGADIIVHLAAYKIPRYGNALSTLQVNTRGTRIVLDVAEKTGAKFVLASTSDVFGKNPMLPFKETSDLYLGAPGVKRWAYAISKLYDEHLCLAKAAEKGVRVSVLRYFGGYGPRQNLSWWGGPQSVFINQVLENQPLTVHGDGLQTRTFTFVDDMVTGTVRAMESENANGEIFNIGAEHPVTILELAQKVWKLMCPDIPPNITRVPYTTFGRYEDVRHRVPDTEKAKSLLDFQAKITLDEGLPVTIAWHKEAWERRNKKL
jgi:UDP-glucose 4-epimerase